MLLIERIAKPDDVDGTKTRPFLYALSVLQCLIFYDGRFVRRIIREIPSSAVVHPQWYSLQERPVVYMVGYLFRTTPTAL